MVRLAIYGSCLPCDVCRSSPPSYHFYSFLYIGWIVCFQAETDERALGD